MSTALAQHNLPMAFADHLGPLFRDMFPDSAIAKSYAAASTKTTCILNMALRPHFLQDAVHQMRENPFTICTDGSNDTGMLIDQKLYHLYDTNNLLSKIDFQELRR